MKKSIKKTEEARRLEAKLEKGQITKLTSHENSDIV